MYRQTGLTRRHLLKALLGAGLLPGLGAKAGPATVMPGGEATLSAFLDTLIPADPQSPSASALGLERAVLAAAEGKPYRRLIDQGCQWLDHQAQARHRAPFAALDPDLRVALVRLAEAAPAKSLENVFFRALRDHALETYYADPGSWPALGYAGPPQPQGFLDFEQAPAPPGSEV